MTAAFYSSIQPLQTKRVWHGEAIDRLLLLWPVTAIAVGTLLLSLFGLALGAAITFGLLAGCAIAMAWTFITLPYARLRDGLKTYDVATVNKQRPREPRPRPPILMSQQETVYLIAAFYR